MQRRGSGFGHRGLQPHFPFTVAWHVVSSTALHSHMPNSKLAGHAALHNTAHGKKQLNVNNSTCEGHKQQMATCDVAEARGTMYIHKTSNSFSGSKTFQSQRSSSITKPSQSKRLTLTEIVASCQLNTTLVLFDKYVAMATLVKRFSIKNKNVFKRPCKTTENSIQESTCCSPSKQSCITSCSTSHTHTPSPSHSCTHTLHLPSGGGVQGLMEPRLLAIFGAVTCDPAYGGI